MVPSLCLPPILKTPFPGSGFEGVSSLLCSPLASRPSHCRHGISFHSLARAAHGWTLQPQWDNESRSINTFLQADRWKKLEKGRAGMVMGEGAFKSEGRGGWVAQSVQHWLLINGLGSDLKAVGSSPRSGLGLGVEPAWDWFYLPISFCPSPDSIPPPIFSLSQKKETSNKTWQTNFSLISSPF